MAAIIVTWAVMKGLNSAEAAVRGAAGETTFEEATRNQLDLIERKLDTIIGAPFRQAVMYWREGNADRTREKLIEAISLNELDLPATALYCSLLARLNPRLTLEYYEEILRKFGPHKTIIPPEVSRWLDQYILEAVPLTSSPLELCPNDDDPDYYPKAVYCSAWNIVIHWEYKERRSGFDRFTGFAKPRLIAYDWKGSRLFELQRNTLTVMALTGEYVVVDAGKDGISVWSLARGSAIPARITATEVATLFVTDRPVTIKTDLMWPTNMTATVGCIQLQISQHDYKKWEHVSSGSQWTPGHYEWVAKTSGKVVVSRMALPGAAPQLQ